jgi:hypothetical protein
MPRRRGWVVCAAGLALGLGACGDDGSASSTTTFDPFAPPPTFDPGYRACDVVPIDVVNAALGLALVGTSVPISGDPRACQYGNYEGPGAVVVTLYVGPDRTAADQRYATLLEETSGTPVEGVGDRAVIAPFSDRLGGQVGIVVADIYVAGEALLSTDAAELAAAVNQLLAIGATITPPAP